MKKLFTLLITLFVVIASYGQTATPPSGSGTSGDPYLVANLNNLYWITQNSTSWDKYFRQTADIDASSTSSWDSNKGFLPIGNNATKFTGNYDGGSFKITGMYINRSVSSSSDWYIALFGMVNSPAIIQNIGVEAVNITGYWGAGALAGYVYSGATISNCYSTGSINCTQQASGGLLGFSNGTVQRCYSTCSVSGIYNAGGFVGMTGKGTFTDCYSSGNVTLSSSGNGAAAFCGGANDSPNTFTRCYAIGSVTTASTSNVSAFVVGNGTTTTNCFFNRETNSKSGDGYGTSAATHEMQNPALWSAFDFVNTWRIDPTVNNGYPTLAWQGATNYAVQPVGTGASNDPYLIASLPNLYWLHNQSGGSTMYYYKQTADIDASETSSWCGGKGWVPIGLTNKSWIGNYDGQDYQISNLYINRTNANAYYFGLFGLVGLNTQYSYLNNIRLTGVNITTSGRYVGALFGATKDNANMVQVNKCNSTGSVSGGDYTGGLIGYAVGMINSFYIQKCYSTCSVSSYNGTASYMGGLVGGLYNTANYAYRANILDSYARGSVTSNGYYIGGLVGWVEGYSASYYYYYTQVHKCYSTGSVTSTQSYKGGFIGYAVNNETNACYWDTQTSGLSSSSGGTGYTTAQMKTTSSYPSYWNFTDTWYIKAGVNDGYPTFGRNAIPTITSFTPAIATPGTTVTISGTNFNATAASNIVYFGAAKATVTSGSETSLTVTVPAGATYAPITVLDAATAREARSTAYFMPTYSGKGTLAGNDFAPKVDFSQSSYPNSLTVADFDGDGKPDIVSVCGDGTMASQRNSSSSGTLAFSPASWQNSGGYNALSVAAGDFDGDGKLDVVSNNFTSTFTVKRNSSTVGNIGFETALSFSLGSSTGGYGAAVADFDSDGKPDVVLTDYQYSAARVFRNTSNGSTINFTFANSFSSSTAMGVACGDLDGDGKPDMAVLAQGDNKIDVYLNTSTGPGTISFASKVQISTGITAREGITMADLDGDGKLDLAVANEGAAKVSVIRNTSSIGALSFAAKVDLTTNGNTQSISAGDVDGDGKPDLIASGGNSKISVFHNTSTSGNLGFSPKVDFNTPSTVLGIAVADFDGDGKPDMATANGTISVFRNSPAQAPPTITSFTPTSAIPGSSVTITGTNFNTTASNNVVFFGSTRATVTAASATSLTVTVPVGAIYAPITVLNTGISLAAYSSASFLPTYNGKGSVTGNDFSPKVDFGTDNGPWTAVMADFDGDGKPDLATANYSGSNSVSVLRNTSTTGTASFATKIDLTAGVSPRYIAVGDVDMDGKPDMVVSNSTFGSGASLVSVFRNTSTTGAISFAAKVDLTATNRPTGIAMGDLDGDGKPDITVTNESGNVVSVFLNTCTTGNVSFAAKVDYATGSTPEDVAIRDIDGDGKPDLVVVNQGTSMVSVLRNTCNVGEISFAAKTDFTTGSSPFRVLAGDFDGDGKPDLATANVSTSSVSVLRNTSTSGTVSFSAKVDYATADPVYGLGIGDLDGDGKPDLVAGNSNGTKNYTSIFRNTSTSVSIGFASRSDLFSGTSGTTFGSPVGDIDGDNKPDIVITGSSFVSVLLNSPAPAPPVVISFSPVKAEVGATVTISGSGFNATAGNNIVFFGDTKATVTSASATSLTVTVPAGASFSAISVLNTENKMTGFSSDRFLPTYAGKGALAAYDFDAKLDITAGSTSIGVVTGDLDGDGKPDMATGNYGANNISVYRNTGSSGALSFATKIDYTANTQPRMITMGDLTGDGKPELAVVHTGSSIVSVYKNTSTTGTLSFDAKVDFTLPSTSQGVLIADVNMDGKPDLLVSNQSSSSISIFQNISGTSGNIGLAPRVDLTTGSNPFGISVGDIDGDGKPDIAVSCSSGISVLKNTGSLGVLSFAAKADFTTGSSPQGLKLVDLDGDGKLDLATACFQSNTYISLLRNTSSSGTISFATKIDYTSGTNPFDLAVGDFDGDGKPDLVASNQSTSTVSVYRNQSTSGTVSFATKVDMATASVPNGLAAADMDGDGKVDIVTACQSSLVSVIRNNPIIPPPTITSFTPNKAAVGATINITGTNFSATPANNIVFFGATQATVSAATATSLTVTVPAGATYAPITVLNTEIKLAAYSAASFMPTYSGTGTILATDFSPKVDFSVGSNTRMAAMGDLDGDGKPDLAVTNGGFVSIFRNTGNVGTVSFAAKADYALPNTQGSGVAIGDIDADGKPDLVLTTQGSGPVSVFKNTSSSGAISFATRMDITTTMNALFVSINDMDADGKPDIILSSNGNDKVAVLRNTTSAGTISFAAEQSFATGRGGGLWNLATSDLDGDGMPDISVLDVGYRFVCVFRNTGSPRNISFAAKQDFATPSGTPYGLSVGDIDGDGKSDIAVTNNGYSAISTFRNTSTVGSISFASRNDFTALSTNTSVMMGDLDGNGKLDLAVTDDTSDNKISLYSNTGSSGSISFAAKVDFATGIRPNWGGVIGDLDGDNRPDLVTVNYTDQSFSVLRNNTAIPPTITSFTPASAASGATVTITGTDFTGATAVKFGGTAATSFNVVNATTITAVVGTGTTGSVTVTTLGGTGTKAGFTFIPAPVISSFTPTSSGNGLTVTITGTDFTGATAVSFGGTAATSFNVVSATSITAVVGSGTSGNVSVTTPGGTGALAGFTWVAKPVISYASSPITAIYGVAITNASPTVTGTVTSYSINPTLPTGLSFNTTSGVISGTPTMISAQTDYTVTANNAGGSATATVSIAIEKKELTIIGATTSNKVYDGSTTATVTGGTLSGIVFSDAVTLTQTGTFASKNVGNSVAITSGCTISGAKAANYTLTQPTLTARNITPKALTVSGATTANKVYDGTNTATVTSGSLIGVVSPDVVTLTQAGTFASKNVGTSILITSTCSIEGADVANYTLTQPTLTARNITAKALTITGSETTNKEYDGTVTASVTGGSLNGIISPDVVTLNQSGTFSSKNVGSSIAITSTSTLGGADAANYSLTQPTLTARDITSKALTVSGATTTDKVYDGDLAATVTGGTLVGVISPDVVTLTQAGNFAGKDVGNSISITSTCSLNGASAANYTLIQPTLTARNITAKALTVSGATTANKEYDRNTTASVTGGSLVGVVSPDVVTLTQAGTFASSNVGNSIAITSACSIGGADMANYTLTQPTLTARNITAKALIVTGSVTTDKEYDRTVTASVSGGSLNGIISPDVVTLNQSGTFASKNVGSSIAITSTSTLGGADATNYSLTQPTLTARNITAKDLTITATGINKVYDGTANATVTLNDNRIPGDVLTTSYTSASFDNKNVGTEKPVSVIGISISGTDAGNYTANTTAETTANITLKALTITAEDKSKIYDGTPFTDFTVSYTGFENGETQTVLGGTLNFSGAAITATEAGIDYGIIPSGLTSSNYDITFVNGKLDIIKSNQAITFAALADKTYGDASFDLTGTASSGLTVSYSSSNTEVATISGSTVTIVGAGTTIITASQGGNGNYNAAVSVSQALTVANQGQAIVFDALPAKTYGDSPFTVSATGGASGNPVIFSSSDASVATCSGTNGSTITITGAGSCTIYANQAGNEDFGSASASQPLTVEKSTQAISFEALANKTYGDAPFSLTGAASSGLSISYTSSNPEVATVSGNTVTIRGVGSTTITASQAGNSNYNAATAVDQTLTVVKANQTISFVALADKTYGDAAFDLAGTASSGLAVTYSSSNEAVATVSGNTVTIIGAGTTTITASQAGNVNYNAATPVEQPLTAGKSSQTISFAALAEKTYGDAAFTLTATASSGLAVTYSSSNTAVATVSGNNITIVGAGTTTITASQAGDANYTAATPVDQTLTVNKANQVLTLDPLPTGSQALKDATGPVQLTASSTSGLPITITLGAGSAATLNGSNQLTGIGQSGTIVVNVNQAGNTNYNAASISNTFDLGKSNQSILFSSLSELTYSDGLAFDLAGSAMASSTLAVTYSVISGPATLSGTVLTVTGSGVVLIKASQSGNSSWNAAPEVTRSLTIKKAGIVIGNFASLEKTYGDAAFTLAASSVSTGQFSYSSSNPAVATVSGNTVTITGAGTAELTVVQAEDANYAQSTATVSLKVLQADQTISFGALTAKTYADSPFALTATATSNLAVSYTSSNPAVATVSGSTVTVVGSGSTTITAMQPGNTNYKAAEPVEQELVVGKKSQAITFDALVNKTYGDADFNLTATAGSGLTVSYASSNPAVATVSGNTVTIVGAGTTTITASQAGNTNYLAATDVLQTLTVNKADQVLTLSPLPVGSLALKDITFPVQVSASSSSGLPVTITLGAGSAATLNGSNQLENIQQSGTITINLNQAGNGNYNAVAASYSFDVEKSNQHIAFAAITGRVFSTGSTIDLSGSAYASSGLAVSYTLASGPATLSGTVLSITGSGHIVVTASQAGNGTWNAAPDVTQTISIGKAIPEITNFADLFKTYGDTPFSLNASSQSTGMITYSSSDETVATVEGSQVIIKGAGTAVLTAQQSADASYAQASATASLLVEKAEQTITFDAVPVKTYGDDPFGLSAVSTSGLTVSYSSSDETVATVSGNTVTVVGAGTAIITATQAGNSNYKPATAVTRVLTVNKESQSVVFAALDGKTYGDAPFLLSATGGGSGNPVSFTSSDNTVATVSGNTVTIVDAGTCTIYANQEGNENYTAAPQVGQVLTVGKAEQTISFDVLADKTYGDAAFDLSATTTSGQEISYISSNTSIATISGSTITITGAGITSITAIQPGNGNYNAAAPVVQSLTVIKKVLTVSASAESKTYDGTTTATVSLSDNRVSGDEIAVTNSTAEFDNKNVGTGKIVTVAEISFSGTDASNYTLASATANTTADITARTLTVSATAENKQYDGLANAVIALSDNRVSGDVFTVTNSSAEFDNKNAGNEKTVMAGGIAISGIDAANYTLAYTTVTTTADITARTLTISASADSKQYDGTTTATVSFSDDRVSGDVLAVTNSSAEFDNKNVGSGKTVTVNGLGINGIDAGNYAMASTTTLTTADITVRTLTITAEDKSKEYDGLTFSNFTVGYTGFVLNEDKSSLTGALSFNGEATNATEAGIYTITPSGLTSSNYAITFVDGRLEIRKTSQTIFFEPLANKAKGDADFTLTATASSGLPVTYLSSDESVATISGSTVTIVGTGLTTITAIQSGNNNYDAANSVAKTLIVVKYIAGDVDHDGKITYPEVAGDKDGDREIADPEKAGDTNGDGHITEPEIAGDINGDGKITDPEVAGDVNGDGKITDPEVAGDTNGDGKITSPEVAGDTNGDGKIATPEILGDSNGDGKIGDGEKAGDVNGDGKIDNGETAGNTGGNGGGIAGDTNGDGKITYPEIAGDKNGDGKITEPEIAGDTDGDGKITEPEVAGDTNGDGKITAPEILGDSNGDGKIGDGEKAGDANGDGKIDNGETAGNAGGNGGGIAGDTNGDGKITSPEIAGDKNGDGKITEPEIAGDTNGDGKITSPEVAGDTNGDGKITTPEILGDSNGDGKIGDGEKAGDANGDGKIDNGETAGNTGETGGGIAGDTNGDGKITYPEIAGDKNGDGTITEPEIAGDANGDGKITAPEILGDSNGDGKIGDGEIAGDANGDGKIDNGETAGNTGENGGGIAGDTNGDGKITSPEIAGDKDGDGKITSPEIVGDINGNGKIDGDEIAGDHNGDGEITPPEIAGDLNGDGKIDGNEIAGDTNGDGVITLPEILGDTSGDGHINGNEIAGDKNGNGQIDPTETRVIDPEKDHLNVDHLFSPNGDGINDYWKLHDIEKFGRVYVKIYDRWGTLLYESTNYQNDWNGTSKGKSLPEGAYIYFIKTEKDGDKTGVINIVR